MKFPRSWERPNISSINKPRAGGRGELLTTDNEIHLLGIPVGITRVTPDLTHGYITGSLGVAFPPYESEAFMPHLYTPRGIIPTMVVGKNIDDNTPVASVYIGNPQI
jgi:hypothetical protein